VNEAYCRYWGITYEQALGINFLFHIAEEDRPAVEEKITRLRSGEVDSETEIHRVIKPDGSIAWQEWTDHAIRDPMDQIVEFQSVGRDITKRKEAEQALRESEERFAALSTAPFEAIGFSEQGKIVDVNEQLLRMFGYTRDEIIGMNVEQLVAPESLDLVKHHRFLNLEEPYEHIAVKKNGTLFPVEVRPRMIPYKGRSMRVTAIRDMTERKQAEEALQKSEERFSKAFQASPVMIVIFGIDNARILEVNDTFEKVSGFSRQAAIGKTALELGLWANPADRDRIVSKLVTDGRLRSAEIQFVTRNGMTLTCLFSAELIELGGEKCSLAVLEDITERKRAEEALAQAYDTTLEGWAKALELRDKETEGHSRRVTETTVIVARAMGFTEGELTHIRRGSILHDIGKMGVPDDILRKNGSLTDAERMVVEKHPDTAYELLKGISFLEKALEIPYNHHEKWDGSGYPRGLHGDEIPLPARMFAVADVWDALTTDRPYRKAWPKEQAVQYLVNESGTHFDPKVVDIFLQLLREGKI
jgi:PAS domain S-box-containing protein/putative nucleotidyltransferase with HDIG domain